jgi:hypothetical protein
MNSPSLPTASNVLSEPSSGTELAGSTQATKEFIWRNAIETRFTLLAGRWLAPALFSASPAGRTWWSTGDLDSCDPAQLTTNGQQGVGGVLQPSKWRPQRHSRIRESPTIRAWKKSECPARQSSGSQASRMPKRQGPQRGRSKGTRRQPRCS